MRFLITGGAGYIGSHMVYKLLSDGHQIVVIDNYSNSNPTNLDTVKKLLSKDFLIIQDDLHNILNYKNLGKFDGVFHFAALKSVGESVKTPIEYYKNNLCGVLSLVEFCVQTESNNIVFSSTAAVYGQTEDNPITETQGTNPESPYASSKLFCEQVLHDSFSAYGINSVALRYFNVVGSIDSGQIGDTAEKPTNLVPAMIMSDLGLIESKIKVFGTDYPSRDGTGIRDYVHLLDLIDGHFNAWQYISNKKGHDVFNLGTGYGASVLEVIHTYEAIKGSKVIYEKAGRREGDIVFSTADFSKAKKLLGWEPKRTLKQAIESAYLWYKRRH